MTISDDIKQLISEGKTQEALDMLQECLRDRDQTLLNQTYLLESQYKELQKKISLGLQDATTELNRINFTLLSLCDEVTKVTGNNMKAVKKGVKSVAKKNPFGSSQSSEALYSCER